MSQKDSNNNDDDDKALLALKGCKEWLEHQRVNYEVELNSMRKMEQEELEGDEKSEQNIEQLYKSIANLQEQLAVVSAMDSTKKYILERFLLNYAKMKKLFPTDSETGEPLPSDEEFTELCEEELRLSCDVQKYQQALQEERNTLRDVRKQRIETTKKNSNLMAELQRLQTKRRTNRTDKESKTESSLRRQILERQNMITVARNICQALVFGSEVDWTEDKELRDLVLSFGKPFNLLET